MSNAPKPAFYLAIFAVVSALVSFAVWRFSGTDEEASAEKNTPQLSDEEMDKL